MRTYSLGFDASGITSKQASDVVDDMAAIEKMAAAVKAAAAARAVETNAWLAEGDASPAHTLAKKTGTSVRQAEEALSTAKRLKEMPTLEAAARRGEVSAQQAAMIADAVEADPSAEARLVGAAKRQGFGELRDECSRTKAAAVDLEERHRRVHKARAVRTYEDAEGGANLHLRTTPDALAQVMAVLRPIAEVLFNAARKEGRRESNEAYLADAVVEMARRAQGSGESKPLKAAKIIVRIDWDALLRGFPIEGELCEIAGIGPVPVSVVEAMIASGDAFLAAVVTKGRDVVNVAHLGRKATVYQYSALQWRSPTCSVEGCNSSFGVQVDHREDWVKTKITLLGLLDPLCTPHHRMKTHEGWRLVTGYGKRAFVGPHDPRHPKNAHAPPVAAAF